VPLNPCAAFGGHADVALLGWLPETLPPSDEAETLRQASAQIMQLHRPAAQDDGKKAVVKVRPVRFRVEGQEADQRTSQAVAIGGYFHAVWLSHVLTACLVSSRVVCR
jgi:hypothetical protein